MKISKNSKKLMSLIMMMALVFSSLVVTQKPAKAAGGAPTVEVLGATLRLNDESGKQSLRVGIKVTNPDKVASCGIDVTYGGKTKTVTTENEGQRNLYAKKGDYVIYTVVITGIPVAKFGDEFSFVGKAKAIDRFVTIEDTIATQKSVSGVVESLNNNSDEKISITTDGLLVKEVVALDTTSIPTEVADISKAPLSSFGFLKANDTTSCTVNSEENTLDVTTTKGDGIFYKLGNSSDYPATCIIRVVAKSTAGKGIVIDKYGTPLVNETATGEYQTIEYTPTLENYAAYNVNQGWNGGVLSIKEFSINQVLTDEDLPSIVPLPKLVLTSSTPITDKGSWKFAEMTNYPSNFDISNYTKLIIKFKCYDSSENVITTNSSLAGKITVNLSTNPDLYNNGYGNGYIFKYLNDLIPKSDGSITHTFDLKSSNITGAVDCISAQTFDSGSIASIKVDSITFGN